MKNRLIFSLLCILLVSLFFSSNAFSQKTVVRVAPRPLDPLHDADGNLNPLVVDIKIEKGQDVSGYLVHLQFKHDFLEYAGLQQGNYLSNGVFLKGRFVISTSETESFIIFSSVSGVGDESKGDGILATLTFNNLSAQASDLTLLDVILYNMERSWRPRLEHSKTYPKTVPDLDEPLPLKTLITDVALGKNVTYFVLNPQALVLNPQALKGEGKYGYYPEKTTITLQIPGTKSYDRNMTLETLKEKLPEEIPYLMIPLETPRTSTKVERVIEDEKRAIEDKKGDAREAVEGAIFEGIWYGLGLIPFESFGAVMRGIGKTIDVYENISGAIGVVGAVTTAIDALNVRDREIIEVFLQTYEPPKVTVYRDVVEDDIPRSLFMIPKQRLESLKITETQSYKPWPEYYSYENEQMRIEFFGFMGTAAWQLFKNIPKQVLTEDFGLTSVEGVRYVQKNAFRLISLIPQNASYRRVTVAPFIRAGSIDEFLDKVLQIINHGIGGPQIAPLDLSDEEKEYIIENLSGIIEEIKKKPVGLRYIRPLVESGELEIENFDIENLDIERKYVWDMELETARAPQARPMSLADYPPFQQLPPELQEYLLQHFGETANAQTTNVEQLQVPERTSLLPNYPNPFNPETWIPYQLAETGDVTLTIYDINGRVVRDLDLGYQRAGVYQSRARAARWDGRNAHGEPVASGIYFYTLKAGDFSATRKMLIQK